MDLHHFTVGYRPISSRSTAPWPKDPAPMPFVRLSGRWLERMGFGIGVAVRAQVEPGRIVLEAIEPERRMPGRAPVRRSRRMAGD